MRTLKFRAYHKTRKEWLFCYKELGGFSLIGETVLFGGLNEISLMDWNNIEIMQYTGLKDKNGKEIYENDVVSFTGQAQGETYKCEGYIKYYKNRYVIQLNNNGYSEWDTEDMVIEIIGNLYENPELLKGGK